jgi:hypothetical protein
LASTLVALSGCDKSAKDKLQGEWDGESVENAPPGEAVRATGWAQGTAMIFTGNRVKVIIPAESPRTGTFKIAKAEGESVTVSFQRDEGGRDEAEMAFVGDSKLRWKLGDGREIILSRGKRF